MIIDEEVYPGPQGRCPSAWKSSTGTDHHCTQWEGHHPDYNRNHIHWTNTGRFCCEWNDYGYKKTFIGQP